MGRPRVLLAEDSAPVAEQLRELLARDFEVVAVVDDGFALIGAVQMLSPDVVVSDIVMPELDGIAAARILGHQPDPRPVVLLTVYQEPALVKQAFEAGAAAYVLKMSAGEELVEAIHAALRGERFVSPMAFGAPPNFRLPTDRK